ncbi:hypothetical protein ETB97_008973 [Aspergillus alliaceus]|uniref:Uncharacterized protein n=1 Tax=Petromyces alliaceus TaxID=209559 RepID=A0A8H5ZWB3_PETAA|nr:hypothetical protein ETB97_008973 [Aspergillus burnettii]
MDSVTGIFTYRLALDDDLEPLCLEAKWCSYSELRQRVPDLLNEHIHRASLHENHRPHKKTTVIILFVRCCLPGCCWFPPAHCLQAGSTPSIDQVSATVSTPSMEHNDSGNGHLAYPLAVGRADIAGYKIERCVYVGRRHLLETPYDVLIVAQMR